MAAGWPLQPLKNRIGAPASGSNRMLTLVAGFPVVSRGISLKRNEHYCKRTLRGRKIDTFFFLSWEIRFVMKNP
jgi:hypothetical protein